MIETLEKTREFGKNLFLFGANLLMGLIGLFAIYLILHFYFHW